SARTLAVIQLLTNTRVPLWRFVFFLGTMSSKDGVSRLECLEGNSTDEGRELSLESGFIHAVSDACWIIHRWSLGHGSRDDGLLSACRAGHVDDCVRGRHPCLPGFRNYPGRLRS